MEGWKDGRMERWMEGWTDPILQDPSGYHQGSKKQRAKRKSKSDNKVTYMAGAFGLSKEPEDMSRISSKNLKQKSKSKTKKSLKHKVSHSISNHNKKMKKVHR